MLFFTSLLATSFLVAARVSAIVAPSYHVSHVSRSGIQWSTCNLSSTDELNNTLPILCGSLTVPLDYSDSTCTSTINLPLLKIAAANNSTKKQSLLLNFGGPGINGTRSLVSIGARLRGVVGPDHDLITWYPRGTNGDLLFSCYANFTARAIAATNNPTIYGNSSDVADGQLWANSEVLGATCGEVQKQNGSLIGTAFSARDAMQIVDALEEDGLIRYWGFSYGTVLGSTIAAMFPDRIDKLIIDGVVNARSYYHGLVLTSRESSDDVLMGFAQGCMQTPERCPIAQNRTAEQVYDYVLQLIDDIKATPSVLSAPLTEGGDYMVDYTTFKAIVYSYLYVPEDWSQLSQLINAVATRNSTFITDYFAATATTPPDVDDESFPAIECSDTFARAYTLKDALAYFEPFRNNRFSDVDDPIGLACARWPFAAKERYSGDFQVMTKNPLLVISNTWDPATPLSSAKNISSGFEGSVVLEQRGYGHASIAQASLCTNKRIQEYFKDGTLPQAGTVCKVDEPFFPADQGASSWAKVLKKLAEGQEHGTLVSE